MPSVSQSCNAMNSNKDAVEMQRVLSGVQADLAALTISHNLLLASFAGHVHGGVTAGAANTSAVSATTAASVALVTTT